MTRQSTSQAQQRARVSQRRRRRGPPEKQHGERSQSGVRIGSVAAWQAWLAYQKIVRAENRRRDAVKAEWRAREAAKKAATA